MAFKNNKKIILEDHIPKNSQLLFEKLVNLDFTKIALIGFSEDLKWLTTLLDKKKFDVKLYDWRKEFIGYDCGEKKIEDISSLNRDNIEIIVLCYNNLSILKESIIFLKKYNFFDTPIIYEINNENDPGSQLEPYKSIIKKGKKLAPTMANNNQLVDLIQFVENTKDVNGDIVEFGTFCGGSTSVIAAASEIFSKNKFVWSFDSFGGIPKNNYGIDFRWTNSFANNSYQEVKHSLSEYRMVKLIKGNILTEYTKMPDKISFAHIDCDTYETGEVLLPYIWERLNIRGIIAICDYGNYPNCIPLTVLVDEFFKDKNIFKYKVPELGFFCIKN